MGDVQVARLDDPREFAAIRDFFEHDNPGLRLTVVEVDGPAALSSQQGGMRVFWLYRGEGRVWLPRDYRTQEGDGTRLPACYTADPLDPQFRETLEILKRGLPAVTSAAEVPVRAVLGRWKREAFVGDYAGDLWKLAQTPRPWSCDEQVEAAIAGLFLVYREQGHSTKQVDGWEPIRQGDQLIACGEQPVQVEGRFTCLAMENGARKSSHVSTVRRLPYLVDSAGGCNPDFDPFRRLPLTWFANYPGESGDGLNWVNSHIVNIPKESSPTHFHPSKGVGGTGIPQREMYLVLDPKAYELNTAGRAASLVALPDLGNLQRFEQYPLEPGMFLYIPPGTGHRGLDVFVNVLTIPGFIPQNEYYLDRDLRDASSGNAPFNENLLDAKNYDRIEDLLY